MPFFGFIPSTALLENIHYGLAHKHSSEPLYLVRDKSALMINDEILDALLTELVQRFPQNEKSDTALKLAGYIKSTVAVLLKQLLSKAPNQDVKASIDFSAQSLFKTEDKQYRIGMTLDPRLYTNMNHYFQELKAGQKIDRIALSESYKQFAEAVVRHFMYDFNQTLALGMFKAKAADLGSSAVIKTVHITIDKMIPNLNSKELRALADYHSTLFHP